MKYFKITIAAVLIGLLPMVAFTQATKPTQSSVLSTQSFSSLPAPAFIVGVWRQPVSSLAAWKARGINTVVGTTIDADAPTDAIFRQKAHGLKIYVIAPCKEADAFEQLDEADGHGIDPPVTTAAFVADKAAHDRPVLLNLDGSRIPWTDAAIYTQYGAGCDWLGFDYYPINRGDGAGAIIRIANGLDKLRAAAPGKRYLVFIECSNQQLNLANYLAGTPQGLAARGPVLGEMQQEIDAALAHGASGIIYFPDVIGAGWVAFDGTSPEIATAMPAVNAAAIVRGAPLSSAVVSATTSATTQPRCVLIDGVQYLPANPLVK